MLACWRAQSCVLRVLGCAIVRAACAGARARACYARRTLSRSVILRASWALKSTSAVRAGVLARAIVRATRARCARSCVLRVLARAILRATLAVRACCARLVHVLRQAAEFLGAHFFNEVFEAPQDLLILVVCSLRASACPHLAPPCPRFSFSPWPSERESFVFRNVSTAFDFFFKFVTHPVHPLGGEGGGEV